MTMNVQNDRINGPFLFFINTINHLALEWSTILEKPSWDALSSAKKIALAFAYLAEESFGPK